jgi:hypothetical protein
MTTLKSNSDIFLIFRDKLMNIVDYHSAPPVKQSKFSSSFTFHEKAQVNEIKKNYIIAGLGGWSAGTA